MPVSLPRPRRPASTTYTPSLPPEVWIHIFTIATWAPRDAGAHNAYKFPLTGYWFGRQHPDLRPAIITRRYLVRVCRQWRTLATPLLYEHIIIRQRNTLSSIAAVLTSSKSEAEATVGHIPLGWWTKRLDLAIKATPERDKRLDLTPLTDIIRCLPNLEVLIFSISPVFVRTMPLPQAVLDAIADTCGSTLQEMYWTTASAEPGRREWRAFLPRLPNLRKLGCTWTFSVTAPYLEDNEIALPLLTGLTVAINSVELKGIQDAFNPYPSLQELVLFRKFDNHPAWGENLWRFYGPNLTRVVLTVGVEGTSLQFDLEMLARYAPKLARLDVALRNWHEFHLAAETQFPPISILGLQCTQLRARAFEYVRLFGRLGAITSPTLKTVRFLDNRIVNHLRRDHPRTYKSCMEVMAASGRCVEDQEGVRMV